MFLTSKNDLLYDAKNFNRYNNVYTILVNKRKQCRIEENIENMLEDSEWHATYVESTTTLKIYFDFELSLDFAGLYKIVFGHYYNNQNIFLYKNTNGKSGIVKYEVHRCSQNELVHNTNNHLIYSNSYDVVKKQLDVIQYNEINKYKEQYSGFTPLEITFKRETMIIKSNDMFVTKYENETLQITHKNINIY